MRRACTVVLQESASASASVAERVGEGDGPN